MREYDHSDQAILMKLIEVFEKRQKNRDKNANGQQANGQEKSESA